MRQGCIIVCDHLPPHWFYTNSPAIQIDDWRELPEIIGTLLSNQEVMMRLHQQSIAWWEEALSEIAVANFIVSRLQQQSPLLESGSRSPQTI